MKFILLTALITAATDTLEGFVGRSPGHAREPKTNFPNCFGTYTAPLYIESGRLLGEVEFQQIDSNCWHFTYESNNAGLVEPILRTM
ncbi:hypothetical protein RRF57_008998 [Xylaria bambusicola]|uniref:Uncharacterized protein n=1 Tax=Xylaria bambusicola TaxID=326684 RepID=A0AAN7UYV0_9PEZI